MTIEELIGSCENIEDIDVTIYCGDDQEFSGQGCDVPEQLSYLSVDHYSLETFHSKIQMLIFAE